MPRTKDDQLHARRQQQILEAARHCFVLNGFHRTTMRQIFAKAKISAGGAYNFFSSKGDIVKALVCEERALIEQLTEGANSFKNPLDAILQLIFNAISNTSHQDALLAVEIYAEACRNPEIKMLEKENSNRLKAFFQTKVSDGIKQGIIMEQYPVADYADFLIVLLEGYIGRIASDPMLSPEKFGNIAKEFAQKLLMKTP